LQKVAAAAVGNKAMLQQAALGTTAPRATMHHSPHP